MKLPVTFMYPLNLPDVTVKKLQAPLTTISPEVGLESEQVVSVGRKPVPSMVTLVPVGPIDGKS
jgi:hypothetical protein